MQGGRQWQGNFWRSKRGGNDVKTGFIYEGIDFQGLRRMECSLMGAAGHRSVLASNLPVNRGELVCTILHKKTGNPPSFLFK